LRHGIDFIGRGSTSAFLIVLARSFYKWYAGFIQGEVFL